MKQNKLMGLMMLAAGMLTAASCTDFSDYNEVPGSNLPTAERTLWQNISSNEQLSQFASLVKRTGFDASLSQSRAYTVWAPANGMFDYSAFEQLTDSALLVKFVKNHVAEFNFVASGNLDEKANAPIHMLNGKSYLFEGDGSYTFNNIHVSTPNQLSSNGILHIMDGASQFYPNLYEYLSEAEGVDSVVSYFKRYEETTLNLEESEKGPMVNGMQTYVDSVMVTTNTLLGRTGLNASIENEDSSYTFLLPTNKAYNDLYNQVKSKFKYIAKTVMQDPANLKAASTTNAAGDKTRNATTKSSPSINATYMQDSLVRRAIVRNLLYSNTYGYNTFITERKAGEGDSILSTTGNLLSNPADLLDANLVGEPIEMSNGYGRIVDSLAFLPWETYCPEIVVSPMRNLVKDFTARKRVIRVSNPRIVEQIAPGEEEFRYTLIENSGDKNKPDFFISLPNVQSATYNFYCVILPSSTGADTIYRPTPMNVDLSYCNTTGALANYHFSAKYIGSGDSKDENPGTLDLNTAFKNDPTKVDTLYLGQFTFPVNYRGLGNDYYPSLYISSPVSVFNSQQMKDYSREFRIYSIILRPVEKDEYEANNK